MACRLGGQRVRSMASRLRSMAAASAPAPVAGFTGTPRSGIGPTPVEFTNTSTDATSYVWEKRNEPSDWVEFEGTSTAETPVETFNPGVWDVRLTATGPGGVDTHTEGDYIEITEEA